MSLKHEGDIMQRAKFGKEGKFHTVEVDGVIVGQGCDRAGCEELIDELNESNEKCDFALKIYSG